MNNKKLKRFSIINLIAGYVMLFLFILLVALNRPSDTEINIATVDDLEEVFGNKEGDLFNGVHKEVDREIVYVDRHPVEILQDHSVGRDRLTGVVLDNAPDIVVRGDRVIDPHVAVVGNPNHVILRDRDDEIYIDNDRSVGIIDRDERIYNRDHIGGVVDDHIVGRGDRDVLNRRDLLRDNDINGVDVGALDRAIRESNEDRGLLDRRLAEREKEIGIEAEDNIDFAGLTLARDEPELGDIDFDKAEKGNGYGLGKGGELYAYNFPSRGVGAGIGSAAVGAGAGGGAGLSAGIGEGLLNGEAVPTLGGVGTGPAPLAGQPTGSSSGGIGGLVGGAGAGGAAGLTQGYIREKLGLGTGKGCAEHGEGCAGHHGHGGNHDYDHLPKDGALHIMMHVDGSGSILNTRKQLEKMKDTILKTALLPYYKNDEQLYQRRVTIVDGNGERTLQFFTEAAKKENVLALVFQDEAQPAYHLPTFNRKPQDDYSKDLGKLKASLNGYGGIYRGVMFQTDRGRTFAKSFKEFVECAWRGEGYLKNDSLQKYYWKENQHHIKNKDGIVFSDVYHTKDSGDPQYYLDLIFEASKRVGLDLNIYGAGQTDGTYSED
tara:strand:+ start:18900 stop:20705 length:1806 start_codon:yes stop_codon:yes gene_type:complete